MSEAEKRRDWRTWEATRDEHALRRYVWALCREAPPTPPDTSALGSRYVRWLDADHNETSSAVGLPPADDIHGLARTSLYEKPPRTVTAPVRRLTVCGPWLPTLGWSLAYETLFTDPTDPTKLEKGDPFLVRGPFALPLNLDDGRMVYVDRMGALRVE